MLDLVLQLARCSEFSHIHPLNIFLNREIVIKEVIWFEFYKELDCMSDMFEL
jgi:hypothetical protein